MSVTSQIPRKVSTAAPGATLFPYDFKILSKFDMQVQVDGVEKTVDIDYTLSGVGLDAGGDITFLTPMAGGETVMRRRLMAFERSNDFQQLGDLRSPTLNNDQDAPIMMIQQVADDVGRSIKLPVSRTGNGDVSNFVPLAPLVVSADGNGIEGGDTTLTGDMLLRPNLAQPEGSSLAGARQLGTGAIARTVLDELRDTLSVKQFGFSEGASAADNAAALGNAIERAIALGLSGVRIPGGFYSVGATVAKEISTIKGFTLYGDGADITEICFTQSNGNGFDLTMGADNWYANVDNHNAIHFRDLTICSTADNTGTLIFIDGGSKEGQTKPPVYFTRVVLRSANLDKNPAKLVHLHDCGNANFTDVIFNAARVVNVNNGGDCLTVSATDGTTDPTSYMLAHCRFLGNRGIVAGDYAEGIYATQCEFLSRKAIVWSAPGGGESGLHVLGGHINFVDGGIECSGIYHANIQGVLFFRQNTTTNNAKYVSFSGGAAITITGNTFVGANGTGEELIRIDSVPDSAGNGVLIDSNQFSNSATAIKLTNTARRVMVGPGNQFLNNFAKVTDDSAGANQHYIAKRRYVGSIVPTLTGGASTETLDVAIPAGTFDTKPTSAILVGSGNNAIGYYDYDAAQSTATNARFLLRALSGNIAAGLARFSFSAEE